MIKRSLSVVVILLPSAGCQQSPSQNAPAGPYLNLEGRQELVFGPGTRAVMWNLRGQQINELSARVLLCVDGKAEAGNHIVCSWSGPSMPLTGQLVLLVQDGEPFGAKGKQLPSLSISFPAGGPVSKLTKHSSKFMPGHGPPTVRSSRPAAKIGGKETIYTEATGGRGAASLEDSEEALVEASRDGGVILAVIVEWK